MTYPLSSDVTSGQPTAYQHYNNLRSDALRFGQLEADAVNLGALMQRFEKNLNLVALDTDRVRVEASTAAPVSLVIHGVPLLATVNVDLPSGSKPSGSAATWYIFAERSASSTTFTLNANTSATEGTDQRLIGQCYWDGSNIEPESIRIQEFTYYSSQLNLVDPQVCQGRLTLTTGTPVPTSDVTSGTLYFTPYKGSRISLYVHDYGWKLYPFSEINISLSGKTSATNYDVFVYDNLGTLTLELIAWASATARATAIVLQDGVYVKTGALTHRFLGTVRMSATSTAADTVSKRYVWNMYNRIARSFAQSDATDSWTNTSASWTNWNGSVNNSVSAVFGLDETMIELVFNATAKSTARGATVGIGVDSSSVNSAYSTYTFSTTESAVTANYRAYPGLGYHIFYMLETAIGATPNVTFYGDGGYSPGGLSGLSGVFEA